MSRAHTSGSLTKLPASCLFWGSVGIYLLAPVLCPAWLALLLALAAFEPIMYASHEALHIETNESPTSDLYAPRTVSTIGMALQLQNIELMKHAHTFHHRMGRYDAGWAPDITATTPTTIQRIRYYAGLTLLPAIAWQAASLIRPFLSLKSQGHLTAIGYRSSVNLRYLAGTAISIGYGTLFVLAQGWVAALLFWASMAFLWSIQQNIAHYGLIGVDAVTDRLCANTYILPRPFSWITYGSTSHFLHHADISVPATSLYSEALLRATEDRLNIRVIRKYGLRPYLADVFAQFRGPVEVDNLSLAWLESMGRPHSTVGRPQYRRGRAYERTAPGSR